MFYRPSVYLLAIFIGFLSSFSLHAEDAKKILWVPMEGTVELGLSPYIKRAIEKAEDEKYDLLVLEIDTFGGRVDAAVEIRDALLDSAVPTLTWVNKRAISAGALISLATDRIYFSPGATMGAATPIQGGAEGAQDVSKKYVSYFRSEMAATAEQNNWPRDIAEAMVQADNEIPGLVKEGEVLTLTSENAVKYKMANGIADSQEKLLGEINMSGATIDTFAINWAEKIVRFLTEPTVSGLLMSGGVLGLVLELQAPGFGLPGIIGVSCLALFFFGKFLVHLAGWEEIMLLILGIALVILEFFVLPGSFFLAAGGFVCIFAALFFAGISPKIPLDFSFPAVEQHVLTMAYAFVALLIGVGIVYWTFTRFPLKAPLVLGGELEHGGGWSESYIEKRKQLVGKTGLSLTPLAPSGKVEIDGTTYDVVSTAALVERGAEVEVIEADQMKILVQPRKI